MRTIPIQVIRLAAVGILAGGAAWAGSMYLAPPRYQGPDTRQLRALADRLAEEQPAPPPVVVPVPIAAPTIAAPTPRKAARPATPVAVRSTPQVTTPPNTGNIKPLPPVGPVAQADPVKNIALTGVTREGRTDRAWLIDISRSDRETVARGESAFGFTVKEIQDEAVVLSQGGRDYTVRLGEKTIPAVASGDTASGGDVSLAGMGGGMPGMPGMPGGMPGMGGMNFAGFGGGRFAGRGGRRGGFGGFGGFGGGGNLGGQNRARNGARNGAGSRTASSRNSRTRTTARNRNTNRGGGFGGMFFGGGGRNRQTTTTTTSTTNPQTARRTKGTLVASSGGNSAIAQPAVISNPQTQRRLGTTSGPAFGTSDGNGNGRNGNRNGGNGGNRNGGGSGGNRTGGGTR